jgi:hypothetical protein
LHRAQDLIYEAVDQEDAELRVKLAQEALDICPDCADAYVLLAENALSPKEELEMYQHGVAAGERSLGAKTFLEEAGHFWGLLETRPYMRARLGLAHSLWTAGRREEAVQHLHDLLRLNPNDNQGVRYTLAEFLVNLDRDRELALLLERYAEEGSTIWSYTRALLAFRRHGDTSESRRLLQQAMAANRHVPDYLLSRKLVPARQPHHYSPGQENEAIVYAGGFLLAWKSTPGAVAWLANEETGPTAESPVPKGPIRSVLKQLKALPGGTDVWQADWRQLPIWVGKADQEVCPWSILVVNRSDDLIRGQVITEMQPATAWLWESLAQAMQNPLAGEPHRPVELQVRPGKGWEALRPAIEEIGIRLAMTDELDMVDLVLTKLAEHLDSRKESGLLDVPGVTPAQVGRLYEAAAYYYRKAPWRQIGYEAPLQVECDKFQSGPWYAIVMGKMGQTLGLTLYPDLQLLQRLLSGDLSNEENLRLTVATTVIFGTQTEIPTPDLEAAEHHGWKVAAPEAYPWIFRKDPGQSPRPPSAWELELLEGCLRAVPDFVNRRRQDDPAKETMTVAAGGSPMQMTLSWVVN